MFDQLFTDWERAAEASRQMQQEMFKHWTQPWLSAVSNARVGANSRAFQKRWMEFAVEMLNRQRESIDTSYQSAVQVLEHALRAAEITSSEDYRRIVEDLWRQMMENFKNHSEAQLRDFQKWAERSFEMAQKATV
jgi:predicted ATPase